MDAKGLVLKQGTLIDATVIEAALKKPPANEDGTGGRSPQDPDADWTRKGGKYHFGYKAHIGIDQGSELVRKISMTLAHVHDGNMLESAMRLRFDLPAESQTVGFLSVQIF